ncbi:hypothetical protein BC834DRAFT_988071 [Gloeopeniophorella convolvens]|nr:hypothetical protein BC834DRAFT_988071 [Gloeopeniophorella convolvens]
MASLRPPSSPSPSPSPVPGVNGKNPSARASMGPAARPSPAAASFNLASPRPGGGPSGGRPTSELLAAPPSRPLKEEMAAASLDVNFKEELSAIEQWFKVLSEAERTAALYSLLQHSTQVQIRFFITVLQQMARADPMTALLSPAVGGSMQSQMEAKLASMNLKSPGLKSTMPGSPSARTFSGAANANRQSLAFDSTSSFLSPDAANNVGNSEAAATLAQQRAKLKASNAAHRISAPALASGGGERGTWAGAGSLGQVAERSGSPGQEITVEPKSSRPQSTDFSVLAAGAAFRSPRPEGASALDALSPAIGDSWASMVNTPLMPMFQKTSTAAGAGPAQTVDLATAKLNDLYGGGAVPRLDGPEKFRRVSKGNVSDAGSRGGAGEGGANGVYGDDGELVPGGGGRAQQQQQQQQQQQRMRNGWGGSGAHSPALSGTSGRFGSDDGSAAALQQQQAALAGLGMGLGGMGPFGAAGLNMNMLGMANLGAMGLAPEAQLLAAQIAAAGGGFGQPGLGLGAFGGMQGPQGPPRRNGGGRSPGLGSGGGLAKAGSGSSNGNGGGAKKSDEEDFDPAVLSDVAAWLRSLRLHKYTPNFEGMHWKDMVLMDEAALEAQGVAALGARRKMLKTFEVVRRKMGIDEPGAAPPSSAA